MRARLDAIVAARRPTAAGAAVGQPRMPGAVEQRREHEPARLGRDRRPLGRCHLRGSLGDGAAASALAATPEPLRPLAATRRSSYSAPRRRS
jgi:hypothetical protein